MRTAIVCACTLVPALLATAKAPVPEAHDARGTAGARQSAPAGALDAPTQVPIDAPITAVTAYQGRAAITRSGAITLDQGTFALRFANLPASIDALTLQAKVGDKARLVNVEYLETPVPDPSGSPAMISLNKEVEAARLALKTLEEDRAMLQSQLKLVEQIGVRATSDATRDGGTPQLSLEALRQQLAFVQTERARLVGEDRSFAQKAQAKAHELAALEARRSSLGAAERVVRSAEVTVAVPDGGEVPVSLTYLVSNAGWEPIYSVRGAADRSGVTLEFDANIAQRSGEDWKDVSLTISTAQPTQRANPPALSPIFVNIFVPPPPPPPPAGGEVEGGAAIGQDMYKNADRYRHPDKSGGGFGGGGGGSGGGSDGRTAAGLDADDLSEEKILRAKLGERIESLAAGAAVVEGGTAVSFELPRKITVPTNADRMIRTRVATITPKASFLYTAIPLLTESVYLRGKLVNTSPYQLVPGRAQIFMGSEYVGPTTIAGVAPNGEFVVYFGIDRAIRATRQLVMKNTTESGVFSKAVETVRNYRVLIDNGSGRPIDMELLDRRPVSRNEKITALAENLSAPISANAEYVRDLQPQGILRWDLSVPAGATGPTAMPVTWTTKVIAPKDVNITHVPD